MTNPKDVLEWMEWKEERERNMTNEEWFCSLSTEEKAHFLSVECARAMCEQQLKITNRNTVDYWKMWLKQPHTTRS